MDNGDGHTRARDFTRRPWWTVPAGRGHGVDPDRRRVHPGRRRLVRLRLPWIPHGGVRGLLRGAPGPPSTAWAGYQRDAVELRRPHHGQGWSGWTSRSGQRAVELHRGGRRRRTGSAGTVRWPNCDSTAPGDAAFPEVNGVGDIAWSTGRGPCCALDPALRGVRALVSWSSGAWRVRLKHRHPEVHRDRVILSDGEEPAPATSPWEAAGVTRTADVAGWQLRRVGRAHPHRARYAGTRQERFRPGRRRADREQHCRPAGAADACRPDGIFTARQTCGLAAGQPTAAFCQRKRRRMACGRACRS